MAQELDIIPKSETYINPYKYANLKKNVCTFFFKVFKVKHHSISFQKKQIPEDDPRLIEKKKRREKRKRGPGMSRTELQLLKLLSKN